MVATVDVSSKQTMNQGYHGNGNQRPVDDHHESNHEFNMFLDREIQKKLLGVSDKVAEMESKGVNVFLGNGNLRPKGKAKPSKQEEFCAWSEPGKTHTDKKSEKSAGKLSRDKDTTSFNLWKDFKPKQIHYIFKHYPDAKRYIEQYRYEHTYNFGPLSREPIEITTCKIVPIHDSPPSLAYKPNSEKMHHNPFRRIKPSPSQPNLIESEADVQGNHHLKHAKSEPNIEDIVKSSTSTPMNVFTEPVQMSRHCSQQNGQLHKNWAESDSNSLQSHLSYNPPSRPSSAKSVRHNRPTSPWATPQNGKLRKPEANKGSLQMATAVSLDTVNKMSPLQILQVKTKGASAIHSGALPLFHGKTMKVVPSTSAGNTQHASNAEAINMTGKVHPAKVAPLVASTSLPAPNVKTLDMLSQMSTAETHQGDPQELSHHSEENMSQNDNQTTKRSTTVNVKDPTTVNEAFHNLQQGTDKEHYQTLVSELSHLDISTADGRASKALEAQRHNFDVTGLTVSFAEKYKIRELGFMNGEEMMADGQDVVYEDDTSEAVLNGSQESPDESSKTHETDANPGKGNGNGEKGTKQPQVHLEKVSKSRSSDMKKEEIQKINEIKMRMNKKKDHLQSSKIGNKREKIPRTEKLKSARDDLQKNESLTERQQSRVTFNMNPEVIDVEEDDETLPVVYQQNIERREVASPDVVRPVTVFPQLNSSDRITTAANKGDISKNPVKTLVEHSPDKASIMRRYFMDIAEREGNDQLMSKLQQAPDHSFKPLSAGDAADKIHTKHRYNNVNGGRISYEDKPHSSPSGTYIYAGSPQSRTTLQNYSRLSPGKVATRQKSFYNSKTNVAAESDKKFLKDLSKLSKLKEIYMKTREKSELARGKYNKQNVSVLHKIQTGQAEMEGMWFDSSGRAYVSLATRYDPVRK